MQKAGAFLASFLIAAAFAAPSLILAQTQNFQTSQRLNNIRLVPECGPTTANPTAKDCNACNLLQLGQNILNFFVFVSVPIAALMFAVAGFFYFTGAGNASKVETAHNVFTSTFIGIGIVLLAWLIIDTIMKALFYGSQVNQYWGPWNQIRCG